MLKNIYEEHQRLFYTIFTLFQSLFSRNNEIVSKLVVIHMVRTHKNRQN